MAKLGEAPQPERLTMPLPGTLEHFKWLSELEISEAPSIHDACSLLEQTSAADSFVKFIRHHRTIVPLQRRYRADLDTRQLGVAPARKGIFRGSVETSPNLPDHGILVIHGQPMPNVAPEHNYTYDVTIPLYAYNYYASSYDPRRPIQAAYQWRAFESPKDYRILSYDESASPEYEQDDLAVLIYAMQEAAHDLYSVFNFGPRDTRTTFDLKPSPPHLAVWHRDYLGDDPDQFLKVS